VAPDVQNALTGNVDVFRIASIEQKAGHRQTACVEIVL
jgi:hypothetical protein